MRDTKKREGTEESQRQKEIKRDSQTSTGLLPKRPQYVEFGHADLRILELPLGLPRYCQRLKDLSHY